MAAYLHIRNVGKLGFQLFHPVAGGDEKQIIPHLIFTQAQDVLCLIHHIPGNSDFRNFKQQGDCQHTGNRQHNKYSAQHQQAAQAFFHGRPALAGLGRTLRGRSLPGPGALARADRPSPWLGRTGRRGSLLGAGPAVPGLFQGALAWAGRPSPWLRRTDRTLLGRRSVPGRPGPAGGRGPLLGAGPAVPGFFQGPRPLRHFPV